MANGSQCCALEICCDPAARRLKLPAMIATFTGLPAAECLGFLETVEGLKLTFAPKSFDLVKLDLGGKRCSLGVKGAKWQAWMDHEALTLAPQSFAPVIADIVAIAQKRASA